MNLQLHAPIVERYTHRIQDLQQTASICLVTRDTPGCSGMLDRTSAVDRLIREWSPQRLFGTPHFDLIHRALHMIPSRHMTHMLDLLVPWAASARMSL